MNFIQDLLESIYKEITLPIINFISLSPTFFSKFLLFLLIIILGYIVGRFIDFLARIVLSYIDLDEFVKNKKIENLLFNISPSIYIRKLVKYYIYSYFTIIGLGKFNIDVSFLFLYLNIFYTILIIVSIGFVISGIIEKLLEHITNKKIITNLIRGLIIYIFFIWSLEFVNFPTETFKIVLNVFLTSLAISLGIFVGVLLVLENKESIKKILQ